MSLPVSCLVSYLGRLHCVKTQRASRAYVTGRGLGLSKHAPLSLSHNTGPAWGFSQEYSMSMRTLSMCAVHIHAAHLDVPEEHEGFVQGLLQLVVALLVLT